MVYTYIISQFLNNYNKHSCQNTKPVFGALVKLKPTVNPQKISKKSEKEPFIKGLFPIKAIIFIP